jgi:hypothetical protein
MTAPRVIVPHSNLHPATKQILDSYGGIDLEYVELDSKFGYWKLMKRLWSEGRTTIIVEHDIVPWPGAIEELWDCPCSWGTFSYKMNIGEAQGIGVSHALGCAKLTDRLMAAVPDVWEEPATWDKLDQILFWAARGEGREPHLHRPPVIHLHDY